MSAPRAILVAAVLAAVASGGRAAYLASPAAVASSSGAAFPQGRANGNPPDPQYAADKAIDGDPATFCCLLDDTLGGTSDATIPAKARAPVTGHMVLDLGKAVLVSGARITARQSGGIYNPKLVDFFHFAGDIRGDPNVRLLLKGHTFGPLRNGAAATATWKGVTARYIGLRVNSSYESGPTHFNFQLAEIQLLVNVRPETLPRSAERQKREAAERASLDTEIKSLRLAIDDLAVSFPQRYRAEPFRSRLDALESRVAKTPRDRRLRTGLEAIKREALVTANPLLSPGRLLFVKRFTYSPGWYYAEFMRASRFGGNLCVLSLPAGQVRELVPELAGGIFDRCDLSFDGRRIVFAYKEKPGKGFRLWEVGADGSGLRQLTFDPPDEAERILTYWHPRNKPSGVYRHHTDDFHPCYLPDGGIIFASTRCERGVLCDQGDSLSVNVLHCMNADGSGIRCLSQNALSESTPSLMNDGRVLYTRWEYVDKGVIAVQALWAMRPDGSGTAEIYGNDIEEPPVLIHGRAVPGRANLFVATATMHHPFAVGPILLLDINKPVDSHAPIRSLTPDTGLSIEGVGGFPRGEAYTHLRNGQWVRDNIGPLFSEPYPLADPEAGAGAGTYFLADCNPDKAWNHPTAYGLWLIDVFGNRVLIYQDLKVSCWQPMPLRPRPRPPVVPPAQQERDPPKEATLVLSDVYQGLAGVERGTVRYLRILEQVARPWAARRFWPSDEAHGQHAIISLCSHIFVKIHHGIVPVHPDGSAHFVVPADRSLFFQALDGNLMEIQRMRTFVNFQPGETRSCIGCHEGRHMAPPAKDVLALHQPPARPAPQPGESVPRPIHYPTDVQPILEKHCVRCHSGKELKGKIDLSGALTTYFSRSYENLMRRKLIAYIQEFHGPQPRAQKTNVVPLPPRALGSGASKLIAHLRKGHKSVKLSPAEWARLVTWVDANGPYYGTYFGRRNLMYKDHPDFRPTPTLDSARGRWPDGRDWPREEGRPSPVRGGRR